MSTPLSQIPNPSRNAARHRSTSPLDSFDALAVVDRLAQAFSATAAERDARGGTAREERRLLRESGLLSLPIPAEFGGQGADWPLALEVVRRLAEADSSLAHLLGYHNLGIGSVHLLGSPAQSDHYYRRTAAEQLYWGNAFNPPAPLANDPSRAAEWKVTIVPDGDDYRLEGTNRWCSGSTDSDLLIFSALRPGISELRDSFTVGIVPTRREGVVLHGDWDAIGQRQTDSGRVSFEGVRIRRDELLLDSGPYGDAYATLRACLAQTIIGHVLAGIAQGAFHSTLETARRRSRARSGGIALADDSFALHRLGRMQSEIAALRPLAQIAAQKLQAAWNVGRTLAVEQRGDAAMAAAILKTNAIRIGLSVTSDLFEVLGASATHARDRHDRHWRNLRTFSLHDPVDQKYRELGRWALLGEHPLPGVYS